MNILVTGANGQLGRCLQDVVNVSGNGKPDHFVGEPNYYIFKSHDELDITDQDLVSEFVRDNHICVIVNFAAYTNVNKAQEDRDKAYDVNAVGPMNLALAAKEVGAVLIHISTDYVHGGSYNTPIPNISVDDVKFDIVDRDECFYGYSKCIGEELILSSGLKNYIILRTSWLCSEYGKNFIKTMYERAINGQESSVVIDQVGCITDARDLALFVYQLIEENSSKTPLLSQFGTYNFTGAGVCSWYDVAYYVYGLSSDSIDINVTKKLTPEDEPVKRPHYSVLDISKTEEVFSYRPKHWMKSIVNIIKRIQNGKRV